MMKIFMILYFAIGMFINYVGVESIKKQYVKVKPKDRLAFYVAQIVIIIFWPLVLFLGGNDEI